MAFYTNVMTIGTLFCRTGEGINRDIRTLVEAGHRARPIITAIDPSDSVAIDKESAHFIPPETVYEQIKQTMQNWPVHAVKVGYVGRAPMIEAVSRAIEEFVLPQRIPVVVDPAILNSTGEKNLGKQGLDALKKDLILNADLLVPSVKEAEILTGMEIRDPDALQAAAEMLLTLGPKSIFMRGGEMDENRVIDVLVTESSAVEYVQPKLMKSGVHGARGYGGVIGCMMAAGMAQGRDFELMIQEALNRVRIMFLSDM